MPRPPSDRVDEAFEIWATIAERNDTRTAQQMGIAQETVSYWHRKYGWDERWQEVEEWVRTSYTLVAPKTLARIVLDEDGVE